MKRTPLRKKSKDSVARLKASLWKVFSQYIRKRDNYSCVTCGQKGEGSGMHAGHYITKSVGGLALYFHEKNVHAQCYRCNIHLSGNWTAYRDFILRTYGEDTDQELMTLKNKIVKFTAEDYKERIEHYQNKLKDL